MLKTMSAMLVWVMAAVLSLPAMAAETPPREGGVLPEMVLPTPEEPAQRNYLGLSASGSFRIPDIKARFVIIEVFNMY